ncbi:putative lipid II flippase FtsW [Caldithrix abyssi]
MKRPKVDYVLAGVATFLLFSGMVVVFSASSMVGKFRFGSMTYFFQKQVLWGFMSFFLMMVFSKIDYRWFNRNSRPLLFVFGSILLLGGLFVFGKNVNGATRWYDFKVMRFQPTELAKLSLIIYVSYFLAHRERQLHNVKKGLLPVAVIVGLSVLLIVAQPDLSSSIMILLIVGTLLFLSPMPLKHLLAVALPAIPVLVFVVRRNPYQWERIAGWWQALQNPANAPYQLKQSLIGIGNGGFWGQGLGQSKQKFMFLPDSHTDFIFSILGEEFGFLGVSLILLAFLLIFYKGIIIARHSPDKFSMYLATGITINIVLYAFINAGVVSALLPTTGLPMPFFSYGGSNLVFLSIAMGILLNISRFSGKERSWMSRVEKRTDINHVILTAE